LIVDVVVKSEVRRTPTTMTIWHDYEGGILQKIRIGLCINRVRYAVLRMCIGLSSAWIWFV